MKTLLRKSGIFAIALLIANLFFANSAFSQIAIRGGLPPNTNANITSGSTLTINKPTGVTVGDIMLVNICKYNVSTAPTLTGWTNIAGPTNIGALIGSTYASLLYRVADASDASVTSYSFAVGTNSSCAGSIIAFSGVDVTGGVTATGAAGGPFDVDPGSISTAGSGTQTSQSVTGITTATANAAVVMFGMNANTSPQTFTSWSTTSPGTLTEIYDFQGSPYTSVGAAWGIKTTAGATGTGTITLPSAYVGGILIALKPLCTPPASPTVTSPVNYCLNATASALTATGSNLLWYTTPSGPPAGSSTAPTPSTASAGTVSYYVSQTVGCESPRAQIDVIVHALPLASVNGSTNVSCFGGTDGTIIVLASGGSGSYKYAASTDGINFNWMPASFTSTTPFTIGGLIANQPYRIKVMDSNGCISK